MLGIDRETIGRKLGIKTIFGGKGPVPRPQRHLPALVGVMVE